MRVLISGILGAIIGILWACDRIILAPVAGIFLLWITLMIITYKVEAWQKRKGSPHSMNSLLGNQPYRRTGTENGSQYR